MKKLAWGALVWASLAVLVSGAALWRTRHMTSRSKPPATTVPTADLVTVPNEVAKDLYGAAADLTTAKLKFTKVSALSATMTENHVVSQDPAPGAQVPAGSTVRLTVSIGPS
jgi:hypothetical protein